MPRMKRLGSRVKDGLNLLGAVRGADRRLVARYLVRDALNHVVHLPADPRQVRLRMGGLNIEVELFASQIGPYIGIFLSGDYKIVPGFQAKPGDVVIDAGAHVGFYSMWQSQFMKGRGSIYAFEPNPFVYRHLERNIEANGFGEVKPFPCALSDKVGSLVLVGAERDSTIVRTCHEGTGSTVQAWTLDALVRAEGLERIDILKMDTEGAETDIVRGALERAIPITQKVVMESHNTRYEVADLLEPLGFQMVHDGHNPNLVYFTR
jgi:FkbM family methyltransferase